VSFPPLLFLLLLAPPPSEFEELDRLDAEGKFAEIESRTRARLAEFSANGSADTLESAAYLRRLGEAIARGGRPQDPEALLSARRALDIQLKLLPSDSPTLADGYHTVAFVYGMSGQYVEARRYQEKVVDIAALKYGPDDPRTTAALKYMAVLLLQLRDYNEAVNLFQKILPLEERTEPPDSLTLAQTASDFAVVYWRLGRNSEARPLFERALKIRLERLGENNRLVAASLHNLALVVEPLGDQQAALDLELRAMAIREKTWPPGHPNIANGWNSVGTMYYRLGRSAEARAALQKALDMRRERLGPGHPDVAQSLINLATASEVDDPGKSLELFLLAQNINRDWVRSMVRGLSEREAINFAAPDSYGLQRALGLLAAHPEWTASPTPQALWDAQIRWRGLVLDEMVFRRRLPADPRNDEARRRYARLLAAGPGKDGPAAYSAALDEARRSMEKADRDSAAQNEQFRATLTLSDAGFQQAVAGLPKASALVAYSTFYPVGSDDLHIGAFALHAGSVRFFPLGSANQVEKAVASWRDQIAREALAPGRRTALNERQTRQAGAALRQLVWDPIAPALQGATRVYLVPEGALHLVNFAALPVAANRYLLETGPLLHLLNTERDLSSIGTPPRLGSLLAVGDPDYGPATPAAAPAVRGCSGPPNLPFVRLPASRIEAQDILQLWRASGAQGQILAGAAASEERLRKEAAGHQILHLATHGFFYENSCGLITAGNILSFSGLALAGANRHPASLSAEDGILTAEEVSLFNLSGVEWVVLSGCDTGLGQVKTGEGVFGLRRAFQLAGAQTVIMSLWPVEDQAARQWMRSLYQARLGRQNTAEAVRSASLAALKQMRAQGKAPHPLYWAAFVAAGSAR
jgi:CHAT domain-containing protein